MALARPSITVIAQRPEGRHSPTLRGLTRGGGGKATRGKPGGPKVWGLLPSLSPPVEPVDLIPMRQHNSGNKKPATRAGYRFCSSKAPMGRGSKKQRPRRSEALTAPYESLLSLWCMVAPGGVLMPILTESGRRVKHSVS